MADVTLPTTEVVGTSLGSALGGPIGGAAVSGLLGMIGASRQNVASAREADKNRQFQERMRATQYQTAVSDLKAAGLNPMLAYTQGGAGNLSGGQAPVVNTLGQAANSAVDAAQAFVGMQQTREQTAAIELGRLRTLEEISLLREQQDSTSAQAKKLQAEIDAIRQNILGSQLTYQRDTETFAADVARRKAEARGVLAEAKKSELGIPEAEAFASMWSSPYGKHVAPYVSSAGGLANIGRSAADAFRSVKGKPPANITIMKGSK